MRTVLYLAAAVCAQPCVGYRHQWRTLVSVCGITRLLDILYSLRMPIAFCSTIRATIETIVQGSPPSTGQIVKIPVNSLVKMHGSTVPRADVHCRLASTTYIPSNWTLHDLIPRPHAETSTIANLGLAGQSAFGGRAHSECKRPWPVAFNMTAHRYIRRRLVYHLSSLAARCADTATKLGFQGLLSRQVATMKRGSTIISHSWR